MNRPLLTVAVEDLVPQGLDLLLELPADELAVHLRVLGGKSTPPIVSPLTGHLHLTRLGSRLRIKGDFLVMAVTTCDRCLEEFPAEVAARVDEALSLTEWVGRDRDDHLDDDLDGCLAVADGRVDLSGLLAELFWLAWPYRFICRPECAGLCPTCGANLNNGPCACRNKLN